MLLDEKTRSRIQLKFGTAADRVKGKTTNHGYVLGNSPVAGQAIVSHIINKVDVAESRFSRDLGFVISA